MWEIFIDWQKYSEIVTLNVLHQVANVNHEFNKIMWTEPHQMSEQCIREKASQQKDLNMV